MWRFWTTHGADCHPAGCLQRNWRWQREQRGAAGGYAFVPYLPHRADDLSCRFVQRSWRWQRQQRNWRRRCRRWRAVAPASRPSPARSPGTGELHQLSLVQDSLPPFWCLESVREPRASRPAPVRPPGTGGLQLQFGHCALCRLLDPFSPGIEAPTCEVAWYR